MNNKTCERCKSNDCTYEVIVEYEIHDMASPKYYVRNLCFKCCKKLKKVMSNFFLDMESKDKYENAT